MIWRTLPQTHRRPSRGFTLIELMCATAIMSLLVLSLFSALRIGFKARDRALTAVGPARSAEIAMDLLRQDIESALPPSGEMAVSFLGQAGTEMPGTSAVEFFNVAAMPIIPETTASGTGSALTKGPSMFEQQDPTAVGGMQRVTLLVRPTGNGESVLIRQVTRNLLAQTELPPEEQILCRGVTGFKARYFDGLQWIEEWDSTQYGNSLPMAIEISLELTRAKDPTRSAEFSAGDPANIAKYRTTRSFFLPCRNEVALQEGSGTP
jgi:prepilin-type N-terminal cleavage/methylation domain-containing protein